MISSDAIRGYIDTMILYLLLDDASYGYEIMKEIEEMTEGEYIMKQTTLYSALNRLEKKGYIISTAGEESGGKARTYYHLTAAGQDYYREKCREWAQIKEIIPKFIRKI